MELKKITPYLWKTPVFGFALFLGVVIGNFLASQIGLEIPAAISIFSPLTLALYLLLISPLLLTTLLFLCRLFKGNFLVHWLALSILTWVVYSLGTKAIEVQQDTFLGLSIYMIIIFFFSSFIAVGVAVWLFPEHYKRGKKLLIWR
jgi:hypothetical protein